ncbi:hypothetical protein ABZT17_29850 [Streptomyces sp. NPDC005648]|uniref:hypothetical protein n=1 Tax=Streptomyces sp. NPDC005648 TaxID=3157044 RepID=UPI0033A66451
MTVLMTPAPACAVLRLHRFAVGVWVLIVVGVAGVLLWDLGPGASHAAADWKRDCGVHGCRWAGSISLYHGAYALAEFMIGSIPWLAAVWAGAAVGRELESGTVRLAWTQSLSPARWLATTLAVPAALLTAGTAVLVLLHRLLYDAHQVPVTWHWWAARTFTANGPAALALPLLGLSLGTLTGLLLRRALPASALALLGIGLALGALGEVRPHLWPWATGGPTAADVLAGPDAGHYHPASHFWPLQLTETALVLALTAVLTALAFRLLRRRAV